MRDPVMKTLTEAATAYCEQRQRIGAINRRLDSMPFCTIGSSDPIAGSCAQRAFGEEARVWWKLSEEDLRAEGACSACLARIPLYRERHLEKRKLGPLMGAMLRAYRREREVPR